ncbi:MAG: dihydrodipicolinate synthase family protein [Fimbriimonadaceae bacterium]|nr:dihydrodipicolinate synthase family protein [Fimbriimonadaceae bacterium]
MNLPLDRILVPMPTLFTDDSSALSEIRFARAVEFYRESGAFGMVVGGASGEGASLSFSERKSLVDIAMRTSKGMPVYVAMQVPTTSAALDLCIHAGDSGAKAAIVGLPSHIPLLHEEIEAFVVALRRHSKLPIGVIGVPAAAMGEAGTVTLSPGHLVGDWASWNVLPHPTTDEWQAGDIVCSPLAVLGVARFGKLLASDEKTKTAAVSLLRHGYAVRLSRAVMEHFGLEVGPSRGPLGPLSNVGKDLMKVVLKATAPSSPSEPESGEVS